MDYDQFLAVYRARLKSQHEEGLVRYAEPDMNCHEPAIGLKICSISGDGASAGFVSVDFVDSKLSELYWAFPHNQFSEVQSGLISKFGRTKLRVVHLQNRMGATFDGVVREWSLGSTHLELSEYGATLDDSVLRLTDRALDSAFAKRLPDVKPDI